jgi:translation initiation factor 5A
MDSDGNAKDDVKVPDSDLGKEISNAFDAGKDLMVTIIAAMGKLSGPPCW